jgi:hypothetical protein
VMIAVCEFLLLVVSEIERSWRFWWFWPLQCIAIVAAVEALIRSWKPPRWISIAVWIIAIGLFLPYRYIGGRLEGILQNGYAGRESGQIQAVQWIAAEARKEPDTPISIGVMRYHGEGDITLAWGWLEFGLKYLFPVTNVETADPLPGDDFRVMEFLGKDRDQHPIGCLWEGYDLVWESRRYVICQRRL